MVALYRHYDENGALLYVGVSLNAVTRLGQHSDKPWFSSIKRVEVQPFDSKDAALRAELEAIADERPKFNIRGVRKLKDVGETELQYKQAFIERVKTARIATGMKQWQIANALGMPQDKYKQYESRSLFPHHLIGRFCALTEVEIEWLVTGQKQ